MLKILNKEGKELVETARMISIFAHAGQTTKDGKPYYLHPAAVADYVDPLRKHSKLRAVAWLHDVIEDTEWSAIDLVMAGIPVDVVAAVVALSKRPGEAYDVYIKRVMANYWAVCVKIADMTHNMEITRLPIIRLRDAKRNHMYRKKRKMLIKHKRSM